MSTMLFLKQTDVVSVMEEYVVLITGDRTCLTESLTDNCFISGRESDSDPIES